MGAFLIACLLGTLTLSGKMASAQGATTATPLTPTPTGQVVVMEPQLDPPYTGDTFPDGWLRIIGKSAYTILLAPSRSSAAAGDGEMVGSWRPVIVAAGYYRVEAYLDVELLREYGALFPQTQPVEFELTESAGYEVHHADGVTSVDRSQDLRDGDWIDLGTYRFQAGSDGYVALSNLTDETAPASGILNAVAFSAVRFTPAAAPATPTSSPVPTETATPEETATPTTPTPTPSPAAAEVEALAFGELSVTETDDRFQVEAPFSINDTPVGMMDISYPKQVSAAQADNIGVDIVVTGEFTSSVTLAVRDLTQNEELDPLVASGQFFLTLDAQTLEYGDETQRVSIQTRRQSGAAWNVTPAEGVVGEQPFNIKLVLNITDGIPELSGPPLSFSIDVLAAPSPPVAPSPTPTSGDGQGVGSLPILWFFLLIALVALVGFFIFRRRRAIPLALGRGSDWSVLRRGVLAILESQFSLSEFQALCFNLGVQFEDLRGDHRAAKMQSFVAMMRRHNRLPQAIAALAEVDPDRIIDWSPIKGDLLRIVANRSGDEEFRVQLRALAAGFTDEAFRSEVVALLERLGDEDGRRGIEALIDGEEGVGAREAALLLNRLRQHMDGNVNIPELVGAIVRAEEETETS